MKVRYIVKEAEGIVVCLGEGTALDVAKELGIINPKDFTTDELIDTIPFLISDCYKGVARLSKEDTWNEETGRKVAYAKMKRKYLSAKLKVMVQLVKDTNDTLINFMQKAQSLDEEIGRLDEELANIE